MSETSPTLSIYQRLNKVMQEVTYVQKDKNVSSPGANYKAVTHDQVVSVARASLVKHGILILPTQTKGEFLQMRDLNATPNPIKMGLYQGWYDVSFVSADDGSDRITVTVQAHANDNGDKAPGKALTYATKAAILKVLCLETGENDESREEEREKLNVITREQYNQLAEFCVTKGSEGHPRWSSIGAKLLTAYNLADIAQLPSSKFNEALERCKKASK